MGSPAFWRRLENVGVWLVFVHSFLIGIMLMFASAWVLDFAGWDQVDHLFFPRQSGAFHIVLAAGYLWEFARHRGISLMLMAKGAAVVFLLVLSPWQEAWSVQFSGLMDGVMLVGMALVHRLARWNEKPGESGYVFPDPAP